MQSPVSRKKLLVLVFVGNTLETFDYSLYGYFAPVLAKLFFPALSLASSLLATFTIFAVGFIARPLGAAIFGNYGDKYGRKKMLMISIMLMAVPTALIGLLPTYADIGIYAAVLLTICRLVQGLAVGAEFAGTMVYMVEQAPSHQRTLYGSLCICSGYFAMLFTAVMVAVLTQSISTESLQAWGWRIPFLFGIVLGFAGLYVRSQLPETQAFNILLKEQAIVANPFFQIIRQMPSTLLIGMGLVMLHALGFYLLFVYLTSYLTVYYRVSSVLVASVNTWVLIIAVIAIPIIGFLAEKINKKYFIGISTLGLIAFSYPLIQLLTQGSFASLLMAQTSLTLLLCLTSAVLPAFLSELFPVSLRYTGMALCYNLAAVIFGGTAPLVLTFFVDKSEHFSAPSFYLIIAAFVTLTCTIMTIKRFSSNNALISDLTG